MIILADENIPAAREVFGKMGDVRTFSGREVSPDHLENTSVLLVRSVTRVDASLLGRSQVRFVGSATIGTDHVDLEYLRKTNVAFAHAPGSNADSVAEYVTAALLRLCIYNERLLQRLIVGIVGCGEIGSRLAHRLPRLGAAVLLNDPPLASLMERDGIPHHFRPLEDVLARADVVTLHVPLQRGGSHPTYHLIGAAELQRMRRGSWLINTSRGPVIDNQALKDALISRDTVSNAALDVWEDEPEPDVDLVRATTLATPHIAGYAYEAKIRGTLMLYQALLRHLGEEDSGETSYLPAGSPTRIPIATPDAFLPPTEWLDILVRKMYDIERDNDDLRDLARTPVTASGRIDGRRFAALRRDYPERREFGVYAAPEMAVPPGRRELAEAGLGITIV